MKTTIVPAQITTVEDKIAGNLSISQLLLLMSPLFIGCAVYVGLPPFLRLSTYKLDVVCLMAFMAWGFAVRVRGRLILQWLALLVRYNLRPKYYVFNKNDSHLRSAPPRRLLPTELLASAEHRVFRGTNAAVPVSIADRLKLEQLMGNADHAVRFRPGKQGGIDVLIAEVKR